MQAAELQRALGKERNRVSELSRTVEALQNRLDSEVAWRQRAEQEVVQLEARLKQFQRAGEVARDQEREFFRIPEDFQPFESMPLVVHCVDWHHDRKAILWGNKATCDIFGKEDNAALCSIDMSKASEQIKKFQREMYQHVQVEGKVYGPERKLMPLPSGNRVYDMMQCPIRVKCETDAEPRTACLNYFLPVTDEVNENQVYADFMMERSSSMSMLFLQETGELVHQNLLCRDHFQRLLGRDAVNTMSIRQVLQTFEWEDEAEVEATLAKINELDIGQGAVVIERAVKAPIDVVLENGAQGSSMVLGKGHGDQWLNLKFIASLDPTPGRKQCTAILVSGADVSEQRRAQQDLLMLNSRQEQVLRALRRTRPAEEEAHGQGEGAGQTTVMRHSQRARGARVRGRPQRRPLTAADARGGQFFAEMAHELRTPLHCISGLSEGMTKDATCPLSLKKNLSIITSQSMRLSAMVSDIVDSAANRTRALLIKHEEISLHAVAQSAVDTMSTLVKRGVKLLNQVPTELPIVEADSSRLFQVLVNLVGNSLRFTSKGKVAICGRQLSGAVPPSVELSVSDSGLGIPEDKLEGIFGAFERVDAGTTRKYGGSGLGLALVKTLVEAHHGTVRVESKYKGLGSGTTFTVTLPVLQPHSPSRSCSVSVASRDSAREHAFRGEGIREEAAAEAEAASWSRRHAHDRPAQVAEEHWNGRAASGEAAEREAGAEGKRVEASSQTGGGGASGAGHGGAEYGMPQDAAGRGGRAAEGAGGRGSAGLVLARALEGARLAKEASERREQMTMHYARLREESARQLITQLLPRAALSAERHGQRGGAGPQTSVQM